MDMMKPAGHSAQPGRVYDQPPKSKIKTGKPTQKHNTTGKHRGTTKDGDFIQSATAKMKKKGTLGAFGKATESKIAKAKKEGGLQKKRAVFAENMKRIAKGKG